MSRVITVTSGDRPVFVVSIQQASIGVAIYVKNTDTGVTWFYGRINNDLSFSPGEEIREDTAGLDLEKLSPIIRYEEEP